MIDYEITGNREGWLIAEVDDPNHPPFELQRDDEAAIFASDKEAATYVKLRANEGSAPHIAALEFLREKSPAEYRTIMEQTTMTHYICIVTGAADFLPDSQEYHACETSQELAETIAAACNAFDDAEREKGSVGAHAYDFRMPREGENNYSQRIRVSRTEDYVLDVIGMTADEYAREAECGE